MEHVAAPPVSKAAWRSDAERAAVAPAAGHYEREVPAPGNREVGRPSKAVPEKAVINGN
jgi:hypothetical protein